MQLFDIEKEYWGKCQETCDKVSCESYEECSLESNGPVCRCPVCTDSDRELGPVCSSLAITYESYCALITHACLNKRHEVMEKETACVTGPVLGDWSEFGECSVTCGNGIQTRHRQILNPLLDLEYSQPKLEDTIPCSLSPCPEERCLNYTCARPGADCHVSQANLPYCECPVGCKKWQKDNVCGLLYNQSPRTFYNKCMLRRISCLYSIPHTVLYEGACLDEPEIENHCQLKPKFEKITVNGCSSKYHVSLRECAGTCGSVTGTCCEPLEYTSVTVPTQCDDIRYLEQVKTPSSCHCVKK
ncbi:hypothetical protein EB796_004341 [Bugula neritina]|uniref:Uncharacterized protein n=1 Tax=Bugula neritina TaxID=10212 RepID=A0A7J7KFB7_BUGNE|nr:hypothetical protein EB796_004341 [Bugula neritina]